MITAFVDMVGLLMVIPLLPFYAKDFGGNGLVVGMLVSSYAVAQLLSAPLWGRISDRYGRRPALLIGLAASAVAYVIFGYADTIGLLFVSRIVQGAGGGTVGVIQAYVADATEPENRAKSLGWLSAATSFGVMIGPTIGSLSSGLSQAAPGLVAAGLCVLNIIFAWRFLPETHKAGGAEEPVPERSRAAVWRVLTRPGEPAPRLIWIYAIAMGAFQGMNAVLALFLAARYDVSTETIGYFFAYIGAIAVVARALMLGRMVDWLGEARLSRLGTLLLTLGLATLPLTYSYGALALSAALVPLGTAFTFPCVTAMLSRIIAKHERGLYMGVQQTFGGIARVIGPLYTGWAFDRSMAVPFWTSAVVVLGTLLLGFGIEEFGRPRPRAEVSL